MSLSDVRILAAILPGDFERRSLDAEDVGPVRIMGSWAHQEGADAVKIHVRPSLVFWAPSYPRPGSRVR